MGLGIGGMSQREIERRKNGEDVEMEDAQTAMGGDDVDSGRGEVDGLDGGLGGFHNDEENIMNDLNAEANRENEGDEGMESGLGEGEHNASVYPATTTQGTVKDKVFGKSKPQGLGSKVKKDDTLTSMKKRGKKGGAKISLTD